MAWLNNQVDENHALAWIDSRARRTVPAVTLGCVFFLMAVFRRKRYGLTIALLMMLATIPLSCSGGSGNQGAEVPYGDQDNNQEIPTGETGVQIDDLTSGTTYYWKVLASDENENQSTSKVWSFTTGE